MTTNARRHALPLALLAAAAFTLTACTSSSSAGSPHAAAPPAPPAASPSALPSTPPAPAPAPSSPAAPASAPARPDACATSQLSVEQKDGSVGAGQYYSKLVFTNTSASACTLTGYPGVSYVAENGVQSGNAADHSPGTVTTVTLGPGSSASATLHDSNGVSGYDPGQCQLSPAQGLRIYPPNQRAALFLPWKTDHCAGPTIHALTISPIQ